MSENNALPQNQESAEDKLPILHQYPNPQPIIQGAIPKKIRQPYTSNSTPQNTKQSSSSSNKPPQKPDCRFYSTYGQCRFGSNCNQHHNYNQPLSLFQLRYMLDIAIGHASVNNSIILDINKRQIQEIKNLKKDIYRLEDKMDDIIEGMRRLGVSRDSFRQDRSRQNRQDSHHRNIRARSQSFDKNRKTQR
ncbi:hypothetical protein QKT00_gp1 [Hemipteran arli-related virus OKIAV95]|uniref:C3H1-type domain-containing protein n=1 Tax=Hemipteran arli-related virus OKIAV95 TaxID=2792567 RepID=A0AAE7TQ34_9MONO|nr:hypothetical protein QKT00_gp1 [Hemipteran arli-related virus OKIAV95]QPL15299.1 hypothetical protein [Hemipteran arli-related virus OKIAV95]